MSSLGIITGNETQNRQITFVFLYGNQTPSDPVLETVELVLLVIVFLISLCGNTFLLVTITSSYTLREENFNLLLANFSTIFLIETTVNISLAILYVAADTWQVGNIGCAISSFTVQIVTMEITFGLAMMCLQCMILMKHPYEFQKFWTMKKQVVAIATFWVAGILLCLPLLLESIQSHVFLARYGCAFTGYDGFVYMLFITVWCYLIMIIIGIGCLINLSVYLYKEYKTQARKHGLNYTEAFIPGGLWAEWINVKLVAWLTLFYLLLEFPYIVMHHATGLNYSTNSTALTSDVPPPKHETALTWFRYLYSCIFACIAFKLRKDIRYKFRNLLPCCRPNVVRDQSPVPVVKFSKKKEKRKDSIPPISLNTPVLYISPDGLCLRQLAPPIKSFMNFAENDKLKKTPNFISYLCDVEPVSVVEDYTSEFDESYSSIYREPSKESQISSAELGNSDTFKSRSQPLRELDPNILISPVKTSPDEMPTTIPVLPNPPKKSVRFSDTVTFFRAPTPEIETPTPGWVTTMPNTEIIQPEVTTLSDTDIMKPNMRSRHSKIPTLVQPAASTSWKVDLNRTFTIKSPPPRQVYHPPQRSVRFNNQFRQKSDMGPVHWGFQE